MNEQQLEILKRARKRLLDLSEIASKKPQQDKLARELYEEAIFVDMAIRMLEGEK